MNISSISSRTEEFGLLKPYTIASTGEADSATNIIVEITLENSTVGLGAAAPTGTGEGETELRCQDVLQPERLQWLIGRSLDTLDDIISEMELAMPETPAARAAIDIALHDALAQCQKKPLVDLLGRQHRRLPTSITIGIKSLEESLEDAREYIAAGFKSIKLKIGLSAEKDIEIVTKLRELVGPNISICVDANQGYEVHDLIDFIDKTRNVNIEFIEQPFEASRIDAMRSLDDSIRQKIAADESLMNEQDAKLLSADPRACGIFNIKLMKCGGIHHALKIAEAAKPAGIDLMWGCMDESIISISAALHAAFACPNTKYLDLDGSLDLARDVVDGGFLLEDGYMSIIDKPGLGLERRV